MCRVTTPSRHIAMWSGPRNISTALMRAWGNRPDTVVCDEPLYAHYLIVSGHTEHPGYNETILNHETDWRKIVRWLTGPIPDGKAVFYQKHMAHHLLPNVAADWIDSLTNCFLIRNPKDMLLSLVDFLPTPTVEGTGLPQQVELFDRLAQQTGSAPPVLDASDVLADPARMLRQLCEQIGVRFCKEMLNWPAGPRDTDGAWAPHWYSKVYETTTFTPMRPRGSSLPEHLRPVLDECQSLYERLYRHRIRSESLAEVI